MIDKQKGFKTEQEKEIKLNRAGRRKEAKPAHHNVFTKKYKTQKTRNKAWELFLGPVAYAEERRQIKQIIKRIRDKKREESKKNKESVNA